MCFIFAREKSVSKTEGLSQCRRESKAFPPPPPFFSFGCRRFSSSSLRQKQDTKKHHVLARRVVTRVAAQAGLALRRPSLPGQGAQERGKGETTRGK